MIALKVKSRTALGLEATSISLGLMAFSYFIQYEFPIRLVSFIILIFLAFMISRNVKSAKDIKGIIGKRTGIKSTFAYIFFGIAGGTLLALLYRRHIDQTLLPVSVHPFIFAAAGIGAIEELVFRGFLQNRVKKINGLFSIIFSSFSHTGYKCFLFLAPAVYGNIDLSFLFFWTFGVGFVFGAVRHYTDSIVIPLAAHVVFDILVYMEFTGAPWWVW